MDITHDNVCSSMLSCFYSHLLSTGCPISSLLTCDQKSQLTTPTYKARKEKKAASPSPCLVDPDSVQIIGQVENSKSADKVTSTKKTTPTKETTKKKSSSKSSSSTSSASDDFKPLDTKWCERFSRLEAMLLAKTFQQPTSQSVFQQVTMPVSPLKHPAGVVSLDGPFIQPAGPASQTSSRQLANSTSEMPVLQSTGPVGQIITGQIQPTNGTSEMLVLQSTRPVTQCTASQVQPTTSTSEVPVLQCTGPVSQMISSQTNTGKKVLPTASVSGAAAQPNPNSNLE